MNTSYQDLDCWIGSVELADTIYEITEGFPRREWYGLVAQMRRASVSICSNIAEGQGKISHGEWLQSLGHARGSLHELETQLIIASRRGWLSIELSVSLQKRMNQIGRDLNGFIRYVRQRRAKTARLQAWSKRSRQGSATEAGSNDY